MDAGLRPVFSPLGTDTGRDLRAVASAFQIRDERPRDDLAREALLDRAFGLERFAKTCERLREGRLPADRLSFVATVDGVIAGTLRFWSLQAGDRASLLLGPLAIGEKHRSAGIGRAMIEHGLDRARTLGHQSVILVGDAPYYGRFGFSRAPVETLVLPGPVDLQRFLGLELVPGALAGARGRVGGTGQREGSRRSESRRLAA